VAPRVRKASAVALPIPRDEPVRRTVGISPI
jgi:hypothetical protein